MPDDPNLLALAARAEGWVVSCPTCDATFASDRTERPSALFCPDCKASGRRCLGVLNFRAATLEAQRDDTPAPASPAATEMAAWPRVEMLHDGTILTQLGPTSRTELSTIAAATALRDRLSAYLDLHVSTPDLAALRAERDRLREALERIAEEHDSGRHDGLPEPCPAHDQDTMWAIARAALAEGRADG